MFGRPNARSTRWSECPHDPDRVHMHQFVVVRRRPSLSHTVGTSLLAVLWRKRLIVALLVAALGLIFEFFVPASGRIIAIAAVLFGYANLDPSTVIGRPTLERKTSVISGGRQFRPSYLCRRC